MEEPQEQTPRPDDTVAFQRFYDSTPERRTSKSLWYKLFVGWWRGRR
ncbi:MAG: hypothetical protein ACP5P1_12940 [Acidimicrobiales bacterium]